MDRRIAAIAAAPTSRPPPKIPSPPPSQLLLRLLVEFICLRSWTNLTLCSTCYSISASLLPAHKMSKIRPLRSILVAAHQERFSKFAKDLESDVKRSISTGFERYDRAAIINFD
jgi:hypothetical protein